MKHDFAVFIGRFQPLHLGHQHVIDEALFKAKRVILLVGSSETARSLRNPFTFQERLEMISLAYPKEVAKGRLIVEPIHDHTYSDEGWVAEVQQVVNDVVLRTLNAGMSVNLHGTRDATIALIGHAKDHTSYYLKLFPNWDAISVEPEHQLDATEIRRKYLTNAAIPDCDLVDSNIAAWLYQFSHGSDFIWLANERHFIEEYKTSWKHAPYPPVFATVDAVVVQSGHVLLIRRGDFPGKGLLAIPGGYVNQHERLKDACVRELKEETKISDKKGEIPPSMLASYIEGPPRVYDAPHRSERGRVITHAFYFKLPDRRPMFQIIGSDDAASAEWYPLGDLRSADFFEDHFHILNDMIGL